MSPSPTAAKQDQRQALWGHVWNVTRQPACYRLDAPVEEELLSQMLIELINWDGHFYLASRQHPSLLTLFPPLSAAYGRQFLLEYSGGVGAIRLWRSTEKSKFHLVARIIHCSSKANVFPCHGWWLFCLFSAIQQELQHYESSIKASRLHIG